MDAESESRDHWFVFHDRWQHVYEETWRGHNAEHFRVYFLMALEYEAQRHIRAAAYFDAALTHAQQTLFADEDDD